MSQIISTYINEISEKYKTGRAGEHAYRPSFEKLIKSLDQKLGVINDPKRTEYGAPDFIFVRGDLIAGYAETKDIDADLDNVEKTEQVERYLGYSNLILTNYLEFRFFRNGGRYSEPIIIGKITNGAIHIQEESISLLENAIADFLTAKPEAIKSGARLAKIMGGKARRIRDNVKQFLATESENNKELVRVYETIKQLLVHDLNPDAFADMYAQTLVYGLFVARYHDDTPESFSRQEARDLVPVSNPFLRHFFDHIVGPNFDKRLEYIVNELCEVFSHANVQELMKEYFKDDLWGKTHEGPDPVIHFYEDFLKEYDAKLRKKLGAFYTPLPVVRFIVRSVDHLLEKEFGLVAGLADTSKTATGIHRVQILDPSVGTGTFLSAAIRIIYERLLQSGQKGRWPAYVHHDLLPRLHGFELMMAPYTIAHLKLSMAFKETGFWNFHRRLGIYLTNSLEESVTQKGLFAGFGFAESIAEESKEASVIKNETPIMVVIGNPPYSGVSSNETDYANSLVEKYKVEPGGKIKLQERKHWLNDDYVKFIALAEALVEKNGEGIVGFITNHGYLDNPTFRGMRWHLMNTFDEIYILNLHGNAKKKEVSPDGGKDENVFDIQQGVAIILAVRSKSTKKVWAKIYHYDLWGKREEKFEQLDNSSIASIKWTLLDSRMPSLFFVPEGSQELEEEYKTGFSVSELFPINTTGVVTMGDSFIIDQNKDILRKRVTDFLNEDISEVILKNKFGLGKNYAKWITGNKPLIIFDERKIIPILYRPFDIRYTYFDNKLIWRPRTKIMSNFIRNKNLGLIAKRGIDEYRSAPIFVSDKINESRGWSRPGMEGIESIFPLYLYTDDGSRVPNLKKDIVTEIEKIVGKTTPEDIFGYIYVVLHSPSYREKYKEFLKIDFPRIPYPKDAKTFKKLIAFGAELCSLHLLESPKINQFITTYPISGSNVVEKLIYKDGKVFINKDQYFGNISTSVWNFYIGGYQPAQKWLKDRKGRTLTNADIEHYQKIIVVLAETEIIVKEIDKIYLEIDKTDKK